MSRWATEWLVTIIFLCLLGGFIYIVGKNHGYKAGIDEEIEMADVWEYHDGICKEER